MRVQRVTSDRLPGRDLAWDLDARSQSAYQDNEPFMAIDPGQEKTTKNKKDPSKCDALQYK